MIFGVYTEKLAINSREIEIERETHAHIGNVK